MMAGKLPRQEVYRMRAMANRWTAFAALCVALLGLGVLVAWWAGITLPALHPSFPTMTPGSALLLVLGAASLYLLRNTQRPRRHSRLWFHAGRAGALVLNLAALYFLGAQLLAQGQDPLLMLRIMPWEGPAANTAICFFFAGLALLFIPRRPGGSIVISHIAALLLLINVLVFLAGYLYRAEAFYSFPSPSPFLGTAPYTALALFFLATGILAARPDRGVTGFLLDRTAGSRSARWLFPAAVLLPLMLGGVILTGIRTGYYDPAYALAVFSVSAALLICLFLGLTVWPGHRTESRLRNLEQQLRGLIESIPDGVIVADDKGQIRLFNRAAETMYGYSRDEVLGHSIETLISLRHQGAFRDYLAFRDEADGQAEWSILQNTGIDSCARRKNGEEYPIEIRKNVLGHDGHGWTVAVTRDRSERARSELLREQLGAIVNTTDQAIITVNLDATVTAWNPGAERMYGYSAKEMIGQPLKRIYPAWTHADVDEILARVSAGEAIPDREATQMKRNGETLEVLMMLAPIRDGMGRLAGIVGINHDITDQRQAKRHLEDSERKYRQIVETAEEGIWVIDTDARTTFVNARMARMLGYERDEMIGTCLLDYMDPGDEKLVAERLERQLHEKALHWEKAFLRKDGGRQWTRGTASSIFDTDGKYIGALAMIIDITEEKKAETEREKLLERVEEDRAWLNTVIERSPVGIVLIDQNSQQRLRLNPRAAEFLGEAYSPDWKPFDFRTYAQAIRLPDGEPLGPMNKRLFWVVRG